ncbi:unnamed protein product, partial [Nesidiocoris tenuis]
MVHRASVVLVSFPSFSFRATRLTPLGRSRRSSTRLFSRSLDIRVSRLFSSIRRYVR